ncbi:hypothetical protein R5W24_003656 [Gemmata sp. JC717]|uniref:hypothetical protein n=1 Tax=Gemmata algarum TaxID=2975278 RepID=UPI0021BA88F8|nr:hypothetical protein [Gemmata algarum]MDY3554532.1 hypothetical protein [Gemmata algarum]
MTPLINLSEPVQSTQADVSVPRFFIDNTIDASPDDGDWWLDLGGVDLPGSIAV